jgi:hypothetical protein
MIIIGKAKFAEGEREFTEALFIKDRTCVGFARRNVRSINLMDHNKKRIAVITSKGIIATCSKIGDKYWYSYGWPTILGRELNLFEIGLVVSALAVDKDKRGYLFRPKPNRRKK